MIPNRGITMVPNGPAFTGSAHAAGPAAFRQVLRRRGAFRPSGVLPLRSRSSFISSPL